MALINIQYTADISQLSARLDEIIAKQNQLIGSSKKAGDQMVDSAKKASDEIGVLGNSLQKLGGIIAAAFSVQKLVEFGKSVFDTERKIELLQNRLNFLTGSVNKGNEAFIRMAAISRKLGLELETTLNGFADFGIAATQAGISVQKAEVIFVSVASGLRAAGASSLQTQRAFYALQQMMSKGVVAAEELRRQLGEALPGANELMVKAYNRLHPGQELTNRQFMKMQEEGKIISREILPEFAKVIEETFAPALAGKANSLDAAVNRVTSAWIQFKIAVGDSEFFKSTTTALSLLIETMNVGLNDENLSRLERFMIITSAPRLSRMSEEELNDAVMGIEKVYKDALKRQKERSDLSISTSKAEEIAIDSLMGSYEKMSNQQKELEKNRVINEIENNREIIESQNPVIQGLESHLKSKESFVKMLINERNSLKPLTAEQKQQLKTAIEQRDLTKSNLELAKERQKQAENTISTLQGALKQYSLIDQALDESTSGNSKAIEQRLKDEVALAKIRVEQAQKGSIEENAARANLAEKQGALDSFMAKSSAEMQLARVIAEKKANEQIEESRRKTEDALSQNVVEDDIDPSKDPNLKAIDKTLETYRKNKDKISEGIAAPFMDAMQKEMLAATNHYLELIKLTEENSEERKQLEEALQKELDNIREKAAEKERKDINLKIRQYARAFMQIESLLSGYFDAETKMRTNAIQAEIQSLDARLAAGVIKEEEYQKQVNALKKEQFLLDQEAAISKIKIDTAMAIVNLFARLPWPAATLLVPAVAGLGLAQIDAVKSVPMPTFHDGGIDIGGDVKKTTGALKSDEFIAKLQRGESVIDKQDTMKYKDELSAIRNGRFEDYIASKYIIPAIERSVDKKQSLSSSTSMELAFQTAELVNAVKKNKKIKIENVDEISEAINKRSSIDNVMRRRAW